MLQFIARLLDIVQRVLERYLLIRLRTGILRHYLLHSLKVQKVDRVRQGVQEILNTTLIDIITAIL